MNHQSFACLLANYRSGAFSSTEILVDACLEIAESVFRKEAFYRSLSWNEAKWDMACFIHSQVDDNFKGLPDNEVKGWLENRFGILLSEFKFNSTTTNDDFLDPYYGGDYEGPVEPKRRENECPFPARSVSA